MALLKFHKVSLTASRCSSTSATFFYDAVIVGGGMVGNSMACSLGKLSVFFCRRRRSFFTTSFGA